MMPEGDRPGAPPLPPKEEVAPPPPPLATELVVRARDVPLPWTTPLATLLAGVVGSAAMVGATHLVLGAPWTDEDTFWIGGGLVWFTALGGLTGATADHLLASWPAAGRWALGWAVAGLLPNPILILSMAVWGRVEWWIVGMWGAGAGVLLALFGAALGFARRSPEGLWWKLPLTGAGAGSAMAAVYAGVGLVVQIAGGGPSGFPSSVVLEIAAVAASLAVLGGLVGLALAERLWRAQRRGQVK